MKNDAVAPFKLYSIDDAPDSSKKFLKQAQVAFGLIPNVEAVMALSPALLATYMTGWDQFSESSLTDAEMQIVYQTANFENNCSYCMPWHTILSENAGLSKEDVSALRNGASLSDNKHEALRVFARTLVHTNGNIAPVTLRDFLGSGYTEKNALEVILGLSIKVMSNFTNAIAQTPLDDAARHKKWEKPSLREQV